MGCQGGCLPLPRGYIPVYNHYSTTASLKPLGQTIPNFMCSLQLKGVALIYETISWCNRTKMADKPIYYFFYRTRSQTFHGPSKTQRSTKIIYMTMDRPFPYLTTRINWVNVVFCAYTRPRCQVSVYRTCFFY